MPDPLISVDWSEVREGKSDELLVSIKELADFVEQNEPRPLAYQIYLDDEATRMTVFQVHPVSASMEHHMVVAAPVFAPFKDLLDLRAIDLYGSPSEHLLQQLRAKAELLGGASLTVHGLRAGFVRFATG